MWDQIIQHIDSLIAVLASAIAIWTGWQNRKLKKTKDKIEILKLLEDRLDEQTKEVLELMEKDLKSGRTIQLLQYELEDEKGLNEKKDGIIAELRAKLEAAEKQ